jgi:hypothetical protein
MFDYDQCLAMSWGQRVTFHDMIVKPALYWKNMMNWIGTLLAHFNNIFGLW